MKKAKKVLALVLSVMMLSSMCAVEMVASAEVSSVYAGKTSAKSITSGLTEGKVISAAGSIYGSGTGIGDFNTSTAIGETFPTGSYVKGTVTPTSIAIKVAEGRNYNSDNTDDKALHIVTTDSEAATSYYGTNWQNMVTLYSLGSNYKHLWNSLRYHIIEFDMKADNYRGDLVLLGNYVPGKEGKNNRITIVNDDCTSGVFASSTTEVPFTAGEWYHLTMVYDCQEYSKLWDVYVTDKNGLTTQTVSQGGGINADAYYGGDFAAIFNVYQQSKSGSTENAGYTIDNFRHIQGYAPDAIISPAESYTCIDNKAEFSALATDASSVVFKLDGETLAEFDNSENYEKALCSVALDMTGLPYGYKNFTVEKYDENDALVGTTSTPVNFKPDGYSKGFMRVKKHDEATNPNDYETNGTQFGYPLVKKDINEYMTATTDSSAYIYAVKNIADTRTTTKIYGKASMVDTDGNGTNDGISMSNSATVDNSGYLSQYYNYIQLLAVDDGQNLITDGGIIEIEFDLKLHNMTEGSNTGTSRVCFMGLPPSRYTTNQQNHCVFLINGTVYDGSTGNENSGGTSKSHKLIDYGIRAADWVSYRIVADIDNSLYTYYATQGNVTHKWTAPMYTSIKSSVTIPTDVNNNKRWSDGSTGLAIAMPNSSSEKDTNGVVGGFTVRKIHVSKLKSANSIESVSVDSANATIKTTIVPDNTAQITMTLSSPIDNFSADKVTLAINGTPLTLTADPVYDATAKTITATLPAGTTLEHNDKLYMSYTEDGIELGASLKVYEIELKLKDLTYNGTKAVVNVYNGTAADATGDLYLASYSAEGELLGLAVIEDFTAKAATLEGETSRTIDAGAYYKAMFWDGDTLTPLTTFIDYTAPVQE